MTDPAPCPYAMGGLAFDPCWPPDVHLVLEGAGIVPAVPLTWTPVTNKRFFRPERGFWRCVLPDDVLAAKTKAAREVMLLPLDGRYREVAEITLGELEAAVETRRAAKRRREDFPASDWSTADFQAEVEALTGQGRKVGHQYVYCCPWHADDSPSLWVDYAKRTWICRSVCGGGGVIDWRRRAGR